MNISNVTQKLKLRRAVSAPIAKVGNGLDRIPARWQLFVFLGITITASLVLTVISYQLYVVSGTAQLDLSRPGYKAALSEVTPDDSSNYSFSASGPLNKSALDEFKQKYDSLLAGTKGHTAFDPNALSDEQLNLNGSTVIGPQ